MAKGRAVAIVLEAVEKSELTALTRKHGAPQALAERARIVLAAAAGLNNKEIAAKVGVCAATAGTWRGRFAAKRIDGLYDEPRPGAPREIGDDEIAATIRKTLEALPKGAMHWSLRTMAKDAMHTRPYIASGVPSGCSRTALRPSSSPPIRCSWRRCVTSSGSTCRRRSAPLCCVSTRNPRCRRSTARSRCCRCGLVRPSGARTTTSGTERRLCSRHST